MLTRRGARQVALWPFGSGAPGVRSLPPAVGDAVLGALAEDDRKALRLAHSSGGAAVDARVRRLRVGPEDVPALRAALARAAEGGAPPRFGALYTLALYSKGSLARLPSMAGPQPPHEALVPLLRALPALKCLELANLATEAVAAALRSRLAAAAPGLQDLACLQCTPDVTAGAVAAAAQLTGLTSLELRRPRLNHWSYGAANADAPDDIVAALRVAALRDARIGAFTPLTTLRIYASLDVAAVLARLQLPSITDLDLEWDIYTGVVEAARSTCTLPVLAAAPWFARLRELKLSEWRWAFGDLAGRAAPALETLHVILTHNSSAPTADRLAELERLAMPRLRLLELDFGSARSAPIPRAGLAALLAAPGLGTSLQELYLQFAGAGSDDASQHAAAALAAVDLPALRRLAFTDTSAGTAAMAKATAAARWAPQLEELLFGTPLPLGAGAQAHIAAALAALAAAPLARLQRLTLPDWMPAPPVGALQNLLCAPWARGLSVIELPELTEAEVEHLVLTCPGLLERCASGALEVRVRK